MAGRWELTDKQWELMEPILRPARRWDSLPKPANILRLLLFFRIPEEPEARGRLEVYGLSGNDLTVQRPLGSFVAM
jgi:hypothetical protein